MATEIKVSSRTGGMVGGIFIGVALIWLGISLYLRKAEIITHWWPYFILGLGALFILVGIAMLFLSWLRKGTIGMFITGLILGAIGIIPILGGGWGQWWFLIIVLGGVIIVVSVIWSAVTAKKKK